MCQFFGGHPVGHIAQISLITSRLDTLHFGCVELVEQHGSTPSTRQLFKRDRRDSQLSLLCNFYKVMITVIHLLFNVRYSLIYWFHIYLFI